MLARDKLTSLEITGDLAKYAGKSSFFKVIDTTDTINSQLQICSNSKRPFPGTGLAVASKAQEEPKPSSCKDKK